MFQWGKLAAQEWSCFLNYKLKPQNRELEISLLTFLSLARIQLLCSLLKVAPLFAVWGVLLITKHLILSCISHSHNHVMTIVKVNPWYKWFALVLRRNKSSLFSQHWGTKMAQLHCLSAVRPPSKGTNVSCSPLQLIYLLLTSAFPETEYGTQSEKVSRCSSSDRNIGDEYMLSLNSYHVVSTLCQ